MSDKSHHRTRRAAALLSASFFALAAGRAFAEDQTYNFDIPAEPLSKSLRDFGLATHAQLLFPSNVASGKRAPAVHGTIGGAEALQRILAGSGLTAQRTPEGAWIIEEGRDPPDPQAAARPAVDADPSGGGGGSEASAAQGEPTALGQVVVTARRRAESIITTPVTVTVNTGEQLLQRGINQATQLTQVNSGLTAHLGSSGTRDQAFFAIRGQGDYPTSGLGGGVAVYFAEVPAFGTSTPGAGTAPGFYDLDSVQVLKGPQGTLFGVVTTGGAVLFTPRMPTDHFDGYIDAKIGEFNRRDLEFAFGGPIVGDVLSARFSGQINRSDGFSTNLYDGGHMDGTDNQSYRAIFQFKPTDWLKSTLIGVIDFNRDPQIGELITQVFPGLAGNSNRMPATLAAMDGVACPGGACPTWAALEQQQINAQTARSPYTLDANNGGAPRNNNRHWGVIDTTTVQPLSYLTLKNIVSFQATDQIGPSSLDQDSTPYPIIEAITPAEPGLRQVTEEFQVQGDFLDERVHLTSGVFYDSQWTPEFNAGGFVENGGYISAFSLPPAFSALCASTAKAAGLGSEYDPLDNTCSLYAGAFSTLSKSRASDEAVYAQADIKITDQLSLTGGYRETWSQRATISSATLFSTSPALTSGLIPSMNVNIPGMPPVLAALPTANLPASLVSLNSSTNFAPEGTYTVALDYKFNKNLMAYFTTRSGYTPGGPIANAPAGSPFTSLQPEHVTDYEIGVKALHDFGPVQILGSLDFYYDDFTNIQRNVTITDPVTHRPDSFLANVGKVRIEGMDLDTTLLFERWFQLGVRLTLSDPKILQLTSAFQNTFPTLNLYGDNLANLSKVTWNVTPSINFKELFGGDTPDLVLSANVYYQSKYGEVEPNIGILAGNLIPGYTEADMRLDWFNIARSKFSAAAVVKNIGNYTGEIVGHSFATSVGFNVISVAEPRDFYVELNYKF